MKQTEKQEAGGSGMRQAGSKRARWVYVVTGILLLWVCTVNLFKWTVAEAVAENAVGRAIVFRMNDVIYEYYSDCNLDTAARLQEKMISTPAVTGITAKYLDAATEANVLWNKEASYQAPDVSWERDRLLKESLRIISGMLGDEHTDDPEFQRALAAEIDEGIESLTLYTGNLAGDSYLIRKYSLLRAAAALYCLAVHPVFILVMAAAVVLLLGYGIKAGSRITAKPHVMVNGKSQALCAMGKMLVILGVIEGFIMSAFIRLFCHFFSNRFLGRTIDMEIHYFAGFGCILLAAGLLLILAGRKRE